MKKKITLTPRYDNGAKYTTVLAHIDDSDHCWITETQLTAAQKRIGIIDGDYLRIAPWDAAIYDHCDVVNNDGIAVQVLS